MEIAGKVDFGVRNPGIKPSRDLRGFPQDVHPLHLKLLDGRSLRPSVSVVVAQCRGGVEGCPAPSRKVSVTLVASRRSDGTSHSHLRPDSANVHALQVVGRDMHADCGGTVDFFAANHC